MDSETISLIDGEASQEEDFRNEEPEQAAPTNSPEEAFTRLFKGYRDLVGPSTETPASYHWELA